MIKRTALVVITLAMSFSGCRIAKTSCGSRLENRMPPCNGLTEEMRVACLTKPRCFVSYELKSPAPKGGFLGKHRFMYAKKTKDEMSVEQNRKLIELLQDSRVFADVLEGARDESGMPSIVMNVSTWIDKPNRNSTCFDFSFLFDILDGRGVRHQYRMREMVLNDAGYGAPKLPELFEELHRKVVNRLLVKMYEDGLFANDKFESRNPTSGNANVLFEERKKNLDSLLKAGVITEEEYKKELEKGAK